MKFARIVISTVVGLSFFVGLVSLIFRTDFGLHRWAPHWLQESVVVLIFVWWIGVIIYLLKTND